MATEQVPVPTRSAKNVFFAPFTVTSGNNTIISAVANKKIRVLQLVITATGDCTAIFQDGVGGAALSGSLFLYATPSTALLSGTTGALVCPYSTDGWFIGSVNTLLNLNLSAGQVGGVVMYELI